MSYYGVCEYCGGETTARYKSQLKRFCSHACSNRYKWEHIRVRAEYVEVKCAECGKPFIIKKTDHRIRRGQKQFFCSKDCSIQYQKEKHQECECIICGQKFWRGRSRYDTCSKECLNMKRRFLAYRRLYDENIGLSDFLILYEKKNPFVWAKDKKTYLRDYCTRNQKSINWQKLIHKYSNEVITFRIFMRQSIQARYKRKTRFPIALQEIVGCTMMEFRKYISSRFHDGMNEANYGQWELDHIVPLASAKTIEDVKKLCHYTNYQPLWAEENRRKSHKMPSRCNIR